MHMIPATELKVGDVLALPMGKTATIKQVSVGTKFVNFVSEHGPARVELYEEMMIED